MGTRIYRGLAHAMEQIMIGQLKKCPFCGAGETTVTPNQNWTGMRFNIHSYTLRHHCVDRANIHMTRKTQSEIVEAWNHRCE